MVFDSRRRRKIELQLRILEAAYALASEYPSREWSAYDVVNKLTQQAGKPLSAFGTLYFPLTQLCRDGLLEARVGLTEAITASRGAAPRRYYRITPTGIARVLDSRIAH